jgi:hypothetical protein
MADVTDATDFLLRNLGVNDHDLALDARIIITRRESLSAGARQAPRRSPWKPLRERRRHPEC